MADNSAVEKTGDFGSDLMEKSAEYYYNEYTALISVVYRAKVAGQYVYYTGTTPPGATDIVTVKSSV